MHQGVYEAKGRSSDYGAKKIQGAALERSGEDTINEGGASKAELA